MSGPGGNLLLLCTLAIILVARIYVLAAHLWKLPLQHGPGYFLGVEVPPRFYDGPGIGWLRRYWTVLLAEHGVEAIFLIVILVSGRWNLIPLIALGAVTFTLTMAGFAVYARRALGAHPRECSVSGAALETRRLGDYLSWRAEAAVFVLVGCSWVLLFTQGSVPERWREALLFTWTIAGLLPGKIALARSRIPLPGGRAEEHYRHQVAQRRYGVQVLDAFGWFMTAILFALALQDALPALRSNGWFRWGIAGFTLSLGLYLCVVIVRGQGRLIAMSRGLRPAGSWSTPFRGNQWAPGAGLTWFAIWFGGIVGLLLFLRT